MRYSKILALLAITAVLAGVYMTTSESKVHSLQLKGSSSGPKAPDQSLINTDQSQYVSDLKDFLTENTWACGSRLGAYSEDSADECAIVKHRPGVDSCKYGSVRFMSEGIFYPRAMKSQMVSWTWDVYPSSQLQSRYAAYIGVKGLFWVLKANAITDTTLTWTVEGSSDTLDCKIIPL